MNKIIPTNSHVFLSIVGASGTGKTSLLLEMLSNNAHSTFQPQYMEIYLFYRHWQEIYNEYKTRLEQTIKFIPFDGDSVFEFVDSIPSSDASFKTSKKILLIFDDSCEEILQRKEFVDLATAGRHKGIHVIFIKHNLYQQGKYSVTIDKNTTHIIIMKTPRIGKQIKILGSEIEGADASFLEVCYKKATSTRFGHFLIDLSPECHVLLRFCSQIVGPLPSIFYVKDNKTACLSIDDDKQTTDLYAKFI